MNAMAFCKARVSFSEAPAQVRPLDVVAVTAGSPQRIPNVGTADLVFLCVCTPRFRGETYLNLESDGS